jgi:hypothetical protein
LVWKMLARIQSLTANAAPLGRCLHPPAEPPSPPAGAPGALRTNLLLLARPVACIAAAWLLLAPAAHSCAAAAGLLQLHSAALAFSLDPQSLAPDEWQNRLSGTSLKFGGGSEIEVEVGERPERARKVSLKLAGAAASLLARSSCRARPAARHALRRSAPVHRRSRAGHAKGGPCRSARQARFGLVRALELALPLDGVARRRPARPRPTGLHPHLRATRFRAPA